jgi:stress responsive alpha/beta barrel protein
MMRLTAAAAMLIPAVLALAGRATVRADEKPAAKATPPYVHAVIFYLKKDAPKDEVESLIRDTHEMLGKIPTVRKLWVGRPAEKNTPKFAVTDYQVGLLVLFDNYEGLQTYLDHDLHQQYLKRHGEHWERVPVYDFINQQK